MLQGVAKKFAKMKFYKRRQYVIGDIAWNFDMYDIFDIFLYQKSKFIHFHTLKLFTSFLVLVFTFHSV